MFHNAEVLINIDPHFTTLVSCLRMFSCKKKFEGLMLYIVFRHPPNQLLDTLGVENPLGTSDLVDMELLCYLWIECKLFCLVTFFVCFVILLYIRSLHRESCTLVVRTSPEECLAWCWMVGRRRMFMTIRSCPGVTFNTHAKARDCQENKHQGRASVSNIWWCPTTCTYVHYYRSMSTLWHYSAQ